MAEDRYSSTCDGDHAEEYSQYVFYMKNDGVWRSDPAELSFSVLCLLSKYLCPCQIVSRFLLMTPTYTSLSDLDHANRTNARIVL